MNGVEIRPGFGNFVIKPDLFIIISNMKFINKHLDLVNLELKLLTTPPFATRPRQRWPSDAFLACFSTRLVE
jgi:hypothetical protein